MGLISRVSSRTYRIINFLIKMSDPQMSRRINKRKSDRKSCTVESKRKLQDTEDDSEGEPAQNNIKNKNLPMDPNFERKRKISNKSKTSTSKSPNGNESTDPEEVNIQNNQAQSTDNTHAASIRSSRKSKDRERKKVSSSSSKIQSLERKKSIDQLVLTISNNNQSLSETDSRSIDEELENSYRPAKTAKIDHNFQESSNSPLFSTGSPLTLSTNKLNLTSHTGTSNTAPASPTSNNTKINLNLNSTSAIINKSKNYVDFEKRYSHLT